MKGISDDGGREINGDLPFSCGGDGKGILGDLSGTVTDAKGEELSGTLTIDGDTRTFTFTPETPLDGETELTFNFKITDADGDEQTVSVIYAVGSGPDKPDPVVPDMGALDVTVDEAGFSGGSELDDAIKALQRDKDRRGKELEAEMRSVEAARENLQRQPNDLRGADALETGIAALEDEALEIQAQLNAVQSLQMQIDELGQDLAGLPGDGAGRDVLRGTIDGLREQWSGLPSEFELTANFAAVVGDLAERRTGLKDIADLRKALADKPTLERVDERRGNLPDADDLKRQLREVTGTLVELQAQLDAPPEGVDALVSPYQDE